MEVTVEAQKRQPGTNPNTLRREGLIPANLYGHNGVESVSLTVNAKVVEQMLKSATVNNTLIQLNVPDLPWKGKTILREVQTHPWKGFPYHISFFSIAAQDSLEVVVPLNFVGDAPGVKQGGVLDTAITEVSVQCPPDSIPEAIEVDVSKLEIGDALHINQLVLPKGATVIGEGEQPVVTVLAPRLPETEPTESVLDGIEYGVSEEESESELEETAEATEE